MDNFKAVTVLGLELLKLFLEENIGWADVTKQELELSLVLGLRKRMSQKLQAVSESTILEFRISSFNLIHRCTSSLSAQV